MKNEKRRWVCDDRKMGIMPKMTPSEKMKWESECLSEAKALKKMFNATKSDGKEVIAG